MCIVLLCSEVKLLSLKTLRGDCSICYRVHLEENFTYKVLDVISGPCGRVIYANCNWRWDFCGISEFNFLVGFPIVVRNT